MVVVVELVGQLPRYCGESKARSSTRCVTSKKRAGSLLEAASWAVGIGGQNMKDLEMVLPL